MFSDYQKNSEYSIMVLTDTDSEHSHFNAVLLSTTERGEKTAELNADGTFPRKLFDKIGTYEQCCFWFTETEAFLKKWGHEVHSYTEEVDTFPRKRMLVNLDLVDIAYMEANDFLFLNKENAKENISGKEWDLL